MIVLAIIIVLAAVIALLLYGSAKQDEDKTSPRQLPDQAHGAPATPVVEPDLWPQRPVVAAATEVTSGEEGSAKKTDKMVRGTLCNDLRSLLKGEHKGAYQDLLGKDGFFRHRSGVFFTVYHGPEVFVIVRADTRTSDTVARLVVPRSSGASVMYIKESRMYPEGKTAGISAVQARNTDTAGAEECQLDELGFIVGELAKSVRGGDLE